MSTPSNDRAYDLGLKAVANFKKLSPEVIAYYEQHLDQIPAALERGFVIPKQTLLSVIATTHLDDAVKGKKTAKCFTNGWYYRDGDFDKWLAKDQPDADACIVSACAVSKGWTFAEAAAEVLSSEGVEVNPRSDVKLLGEALIRGGHTLTLPQIEVLKERTERGEDTGLRTDCYGNFFFVETGDSVNPVSVGGVNRGGRGWNAGVNQLGNVGRWDAGRRLLVRNLDASKL